MFLFICRFLQSYVFACVFFIFCIWIFSDFEFSDFSDFWNCMFGLLLVLSLVFMCFYGFCVFRMFVFGGVCVCLLSFGFVRCFASLWGGSGLQSALPFVSLSCFSFPSLRYPQRPLQVLICSRGYRVKPLRGGLALLWWLTFGCFVLRKDKHRWSMCVRT